MKATRVTLDQWRALQAVVDCGGYAQAAAWLHRSQSSVSHAVARMQTQLGVRLLRVEGRKARLTKVGRILLQQARQLLDDAARLESQARRLEQGWEVELRLVVDTAFPTALLMRALQHFVPLGGGTRVQLEEMVLSGVDEALQMGTVDIAIGGQVPQGFLGDPLLHMEFIAVAHPAHPLHALERPLSAADLRRETQVVVRDSGTAHKRDSGWLGAEQRWTVGGLETALLAVCHGLGFAWLPDHLIAPALADGRLRPLPLREGQRYSASLCLIVAHPDRPGPAARELLRILRETAATWSAAN
ncbi:Transcriptional regulator, LysR family [hydrothermal vent metagenome]|uniref:Transcriptional regulator, LysR family n=1 Tax=hydrothermal vent metagenome TaxID=652676 RepID=A0A3B1A1G4_9ZZZZ